MSAKSIVFWETFLSGSSPITADFGWILEYFSNSFDIEESIFAVLLLLVVVDSGTVIWEMLLCEP